MDGGTRIWTNDETALWRRLDAHRFDDPALDLDFTRRLARTMDWSLAEARDGLREYRRFCFLAMVSPAPVTPSEEIDAIWHLHLTCTRDYWDRWCAGVLRRPLHHDPTTGGADQQVMFRRQYAETLALYDDYFGAPDAAFWPGFARRFRRASRYRLIDRDRLAVVPRPALARRLAWLPGLGLLLGLGACASDGRFDVLDWTGPDFLQFYVPVLLGATALGAAIRWLLGETGAAVLAQELTPVEIAYLKGGHVRAVDTLVLELATREAAEMQKGGVRILEGARRLPSAFEPFRSLAPDLYTRTQMLRTMKGSDAADRMVERLADRNLVRDAGRRALSQALTLLPIGLVLALGVAKLCVGLSRGKPVGFLILLLLCGVFAAVRLMRDPWRTAAGSAALSTIRERMDRAARTPRQGEIPLAYALVGTAALTGTAYAAYGATIGAGGSDGGSGCGGGGGGGGGCGGCGG